MRYTEVVVVVPLIEGTRQQIAEVIATAEDQGDAVTFDCGVTVGASVLINLHIVDALETAYAFGLQVRLRAGGDPALSVEIDFDPYLQTDFNSLVRAWLPLTYAVNGLNHSVGQPDLYPFVLAPTVMGKLRFIRGLVHRAPAAGSRSS